MNIKEYSLKIKGKCLINNCDKIIISEGTIYPLLRRLVKENYLESYYKPSKEGPSRKYYSITVKGNKRLHELIKEWESFTEAINSFMKENDIHE